MGPPPTGARNAGGVGKNYVFRPVAVSGLDALPLEICVHPPQWFASHDGAPSQEYGVSLTTMVVVEVCLSHARLISALSYVYTIQPVVQRQVLSCKRGFTFMRQKA